MCRGLLDKLGIKTYIGIKLSFGQYDLFLFSFLFYHLMASKVGGGRL